MKPDEGLRAAGGNWLERVRFGMVPQVHAELHLLCAAAHRDQRARLDHHRRGGRRRHRRELPAARLGNDHPAKTYAIIILLFLTIILIDWISGCLRKTPGRQCGLPVRGLRSHVCHHPTDRRSRRTAKRHARCVPPAAAEPPHGAAGRAGRPRAYLVFCFFFFNIPGVVADAQWERAGTYIADWYSWEATPRFRFEDDGIKLEWTRSLLGDNPDPDWIEQNGSRAPVTLRRRRATGSRSARPMSSRSSAGSAITVPITAARRRLARRRAVADVAEERPGHRRLRLHRAGGNPQHPGVRAAPLPRLAELLLRHQVAVLRHGAGRAVGMRRPAASAIDPAMLELAADRHGVPLQHRVAASRRLQQAAADHRHGVRRHAVRRHRRVPAVVPRGAQHHAESGSATGS